MAIGHRLKNVDNIEYDLKEGHVTLNLQYIAYRLQIDDESRLIELIGILQKFLKHMQDEKKSQDDINVPTFYIEGGRKK